MKLKVFIIFAIALCASAADVTENENAEPSKEKRQSQEGTLSHLVYRSAKQEQIAPVEEPQEDDKSALRNRTSLQPASEEPGAKVDRPAREQPMTVELSTSAPAVEQSTNEQTSNSIDTSSETPQPPNVQQVDIEHRGLSLEDRRQSAIPPPRDGKSYTPEEFTSLIVAGYAVTPIPDISFDVAESNSLVSSYPTTSNQGITPTPIYVNNNLPGISSPTPFALRDEQAKIHQARLELGLHHYKQRLALQQSLPPPRNSKSYTPDEFNSLIAAGYSVTPVPVNSYGVEVAQSSRADEAYRPGQVFSLNPQELLDLQPERKTPLPSNQYLQQLYGNSQQEHKHNLQQQQIYYLEPQSQSGRQEHKHNLQQQQLYYLEPQSQSGRQAPPSHAVIARPQFNFNGGEASVGAALSVSDTGSSSSGDSFNQELLALLGQAVRPQESRGQAQQSSTVQSVAPQYQQIDRYITKPSKKPTKLRSKVRVEQQPQPTVAPQQYLIETTNVQQQSQQQQYRPTQQPQRLAQSLRYVPIQQSTRLDQFLYEREQPEPQGLKIVPAPKLSQQPRTQFNYRLAPQASQYQQPEVAPAPKQYRIVELPRAQPIRQELRLPASSVERPVAYLKRFPEVDKQRSVKIYDPIVPENQQSTQLYGEQFVLRPLYRSNEQQRPRYEIAQPKLEQSPTKAPHSAIYVSKNIPLRSQKVRPLSLREQSLEQSNIEIVQHGQSLDEQRSQLPPPKNNKAYTPEEFAALVAAGYSVTPVPVSALNLDVAQSRTSIETVTAQPKRRQTQRRRNQYLPVRDDAP